MKLISTVLLILIMASASYGQGKITLSGKIKDEQSKADLEFCTVSVYNLKDSLISGTVTDRRGFFSSELPMGIYNLVFSYVGNLSDTLQQVTAYEDKFLGTFALRPDLRMLEEVSIEASSRSSEIDRDVQVVTNEMREGTFSAKYVLNKMNGVHYDEFNNAIKVDNDSRVIILVDGIEKDQEYAKNLDPDRIKKIEVIRDPSGRYGLAGYAAVINIILDKDYMGIELFVQERGLFDPDARQADYMAVQNNPSATLTYTYNKFSIYGKLSNSYNNYNMDSYESKHYSSGLSIEKVPAFEDVASIKVKQQSTDLTLGADYFINPRHTLSYEGRLFKFPERSNLVDVSQLINTFQNGNLVTSYATDVGVNSNSLNMYNSIFYEGKLNENNTLRSNLVYSNYRNSQTVEYTGEGAADYGQDGSDYKQNNNAYLEYDHIFKDKSSLMLGYGYTLENLASTFTSDWMQNDFNTFEWRNKIYAYYTRKFGEHFALKLGTAGETSARHVDDRVNNYFIFLPHIDFKYDITENFNIKLKLRSDGNYPSINQTNPFTTFVDLESVQTGNPDLMPEVTKRFSLQASVMKGAISVEPYYHISDNMIITTGMLRADSVFEYNYHNAGAYRNYGVKTNVSLPFGKSVFFQSSLDLYKSSVEFEAYHNTISDWAMSSQLIYFHAKSKTVAGIGYQRNNNKRILAQGYQQQNVDFWMALVRRPFFKDRLSLMLVYFAPITLGIDSDQVKFIETETYTEIETTSMAFFKNMLMLEASFRFNKGKVLTRDKEVDYIRERENNSLF